VTCPFCAGSRIDPECPFERACPVCEKSPPRLVLIKGGKENVDNFRESSPLFFDPPDRRQDP
jgi:hypothetical protein